MLGTKLTIAIAILALSQNLRAELVFLPESHHQQFLTYAFFLEEHTSLVARNANRAWGSLAASIALLEKSDWRSQLIAFGSANSSFRLNERRDTLLTETIDARAGLRIELNATEKTRVSIGWTHESGHVSDNIENLELLGSNLGNEILHGRVFYDCIEQVRIGATLKPVIGSDPGMKTWGSDVFFEVFPLGQSTNPRKPVPYLALGLQQTGTDVIRLTRELQLGVYFGNHTQLIHKSTLRVVAGYYNGVDPRLKYAQIKFSTVEFGYLGLNFDL